MKKYMYLMSISLFSLMMMTSYNNAYSQFGLGKIKNNVKKNSNKSSSENETNKSSNTSVSCRYLYSQSIKSDYSGGSFQKAQWVSSPRGSMNEKSGDINPGMNYPVSCKLKF